MYLRQEIVGRAVDQLADLHPFFGITFLVCKQLRIPIGRKKSFSINNAEDDFLDRYYRPNLASSYYFLPYKGSGKARWRSARYASTGSQKTRTSGHLSTAFLHDRGQDLWGWQSNYVEVLQEQLVRDKIGRIPAFWLAAWLYRHNNWSSNTFAVDIVNTLMAEFSITKQERDSLFQISIPDLPDPLLADGVFRDDILLQSIELPKDAVPNEGGTLRQLHLTNVGPVSSLDFKPAERLSIVTGDNGLGKTFILECCWWCLTNNWAETGKQILPHTASKPATMSFTIGSKDGSPVIQDAQYDTARATWLVKEDRMTIPGLIVYARVDGSFAVWDPARLTQPALDKRNPGLLLFSRDEVLGGLDGIIEGLIRDWVKWQSSKDKTIFETFCRVLAILSPPDMAPLVPGEPQRIPPDPRDIPTLIHDFGTVPFTHESAGVRRIVTFAYLLVWAWHEHKLYSSLIGKNPQTNIIMMIDEVEAHLHPKWQRVVLPALLSVTNKLSDDISPQLIIATHSPLILASIEPEFSEDTDKLFHLHLRNALGKIDREVTVDQIPFIKLGTVDSWLTSNVFELDEPRSKPGEDALDEAKRMIDVSNNDMNMISIVHENLRQSLPPDDPFWPQWLHFAQMKGMNL